MASPRRPTAYAYCASTTTSAASHRQHTDRRSLAPARRTPLNAYARVGAETSAPPRLDVRVSPAHADPRLSHPLATQAQDCRMQDAVASPGRSHCACMAHPFGIRTLPPALPRNEQQRDTRRSLFHRALHLHHQSSPDGDMRLAIPGTPCLILGASFACPSCLGSSCGASGAQSSASSGIYTRENTHGSRECEFG